MIHFQDTSIWSLFFAAALALASITFYLVSKENSYIRILRSLILIFLAILTLSPSWRIDLDNNDIILVDYSSSFSKGIRSELLSKATSISQTAAKLEFSDKIIDANSEKSINYSRTDLESAIKESAGQSSNRNILLVSDGFENKGSIQRIISDLKQRNIKVYPLIDYSYVKKVKTCEIKEFEAPISAAAQSSVEIRVVIANETSQKCQGILDIKQDDKVLLSESITLDSSDTKLIKTNSDPNLDGKRKLSAVFTPYGSNSSQQKHRYLTTSKREKILLLNGTSLDARVISPLLRQQSFQVDEYFSDQTIFPQIQFQEYSTVILNNLSLKSQSEDFTSAVHDYVYNGGNVIVFGGERAFGLGGYRDSNLEKALPVFSLPPQTEQKRLNAAVQLVIDKSKSMEQQSRLDFVKAASKEVIRVLKPDDYLGLVAFDNEPFVVIPINRLDQIREQALSLVDRFFPSGSTRLLKALQLAGRGLERVPAGRKHIIVLTDGRLPDAGPMYVELVKQLRITGVTVSSVLISDEDGSYPLKEMAEVGGGVFYVTSDPSNLPRIFLQDIRVSTGEKTVKESIQYDIKKGPSGIISTSVQSFPRLKGYVQTKAKEDSKVELMIAEPGQNPEPLLVSWQYGKGRSVAFTSDIYGRWSDDWTRWDNLSQFILDLTSSKENSNNPKSAIDFDVRTKLNGSQLTVELFVYSDISLNQVTGTLDEKNLSLQKKANGRYEASIDLDNIKESYDLNFSVNQSKLPTITFAIDKESLTDQLDRGTNLPLLSQIASETGGKINPTQLPKSDKKDHKFEPLDSVFYLLLGILLLLEVFIRERRPKLRLKRTWARR
jgi:uncharacterized membrane protein